MKFLFEFKWSKDFDRWDFDYWNLPAGVEEIAAWLSDDIQYEGSAYRMIELLRKIQSGEEKKGYIGTGNAHSSYAFDDKLFLECQFAEEQKVALPIEEAIKALEGYARFHEEGNINDPNYQPKSFSVSYDAEGEAAAALYEATGLPWGLTEEEIEETTKRIKVMIEKERLERRKNKKKR